ncbi:hypothetical protein MRB53_016924 [Persea americana]|uniref:Uncharacterized protein n=1 Tax=Persea americana TaxID=3435 RepID=A0ACC2M3P7_PERAE|nr:hypothetical protein MRB53_016924 [Persea americana]
MGRAKVPLKLIECQKSRNATFMKRRKGLRKKTFEFATLCGVDVCLICLGPQGDRQHETEIWPNDRPEVRRIIKRYKSLSKDEQVRRKLDLSSLLEQRNKKLEEELKHRSVEKENVMYPSWDDRLNEFPIEMLQDLLATLDSKMETVNRKVELMMNNHSSQGKELSVEISPQAYLNQGMLDNYKTLDDDNRMAIQPVPPAPISYVRPLDQGHMPVELPYIPEIPCYSNSNFNTNSNNMLPPPIMGYYVTPGMGTLGTNMFHNHNELSVAGCSQCFMQLQSSSVMGSPSPNSNSRSVHKLIVHQSHHLNQGFSEFQMFQTKRQRY